MSPAAESIDLSVIIPVFNEQDNVRPLFERLDGILRRLDRTCEIIFVDDGSRDETFRRLEELHARHEHLRIIKLRRNFGQTPAMAAGFDAARGEVIVTMDGDLQNDPADIPRLLDRIEEGYDVVSGWRVHRRDTFVTRILPSKAANWLIGRITGVRIHDYGCTLKAYRRSVIKNLHLYAEMHRFVPAMTTIAGARVGELAVSHHPRIHGRSKYGISRIGKVLLDLVTVKLLIRFSPNPGHWFGIFSLPFWIIGSFIGLWSVHAALRPHPEGFSIVLPALGVVILFSAFFLVLLGLLGELVVKTGSYHIAQINRPVIEEER
jgi:glycosyltransferase involved in cell wall biosynthesis